MAMSEAERKAKRNAYDRAYHASRRETRLPQMKAWRDANPEKQLAATEAWKEANPDKVKAHEKTKRERHSKTIQARQKRWRDENPDKVAAQSCRAVHKRRARKLAVGGDISAADLRSIREMADDICAYCLKPCDEMHLEHCIPLVRGGANTPDNCVMACPSCNARKGAKMPLEFLCGLPKLGVAA